MIGDFSGKSAGSMTRDRMLSLACDMVGCNQYACGFNGGETAFAHLTLRLFVQIAADSKMSASVLFLDVATAFASLLRAIVFDINDGDEGWYFRLHENGFDHEDIIAIREALIFFANDDQFESSSDFTSTRYIHLFMQPFYNYTWFSQDFSKNVVRTKRGGPCWHAYVRYCLCDCDF